MKKTIAILMILMLLLAAGCWKKAYRASEPQAATAAPAAEAAVTMAPPAVPTVTEAPAHRIGDAQALGGAGSELDGGGTVIRGGRDVEEDYLVSALAVIDARELDGVAGIAQVHEVHALHHTAVLHVEAGDHALGQHAGPP